MIAMVACGHISIHRIICDIVEERDSRSLEKVVQQPCNNESKGWQHSQVPLRTRRQDCSCIVPALCTSFLCKFEGTIGE